MKDYKAIDQERNGINRRGFIAKTIFAAAGSLALAASQNEASAQTGTRNNTKSAANSAIGRRRLGKLVKGQRLPDAVLALSGVEAPIKG